MSRGEALLLHLSNLLVGGTGLVYAWMLYALEPADPFSLVNHPWQPHVQHLHVLLAPLLVFAAGLIWRDHVWKGWRLGLRDRTGLSLVLTLTPMVASGYLIQTATDDAWRRIWVIVHLTASALWLLGYLSHQLLPRRREAPSPAPQRAPADRELRRDGV